MLNPLIATSTYLFWVHTPYIAREQSPLGNKCNCSTGDFLQNRCKEYKGYLKLQNYPAELVDKQFNKALSIPRAELLRGKIQVLDYHPILPDIQKVIKKHFYLLQSSPEVKEIFPPKLIFPTYCRAKNLKEMLLPSKFRITSSRHQREEDRGCSKCDKKCYLWKNYLIPALKFQSSATGCLTGSSLLGIPNSTLLIYIYIYICFLIEAVYFHKEFSYSVCHVSVQRTFYDLLFS